MEGNIILEGTFGGKLFLEGNHSIFWQETNFWRESIFWREIQIQNSNTRSCRGAKEDVELLLQHHQQWKETGHGDNWRETGHRDNWTKLKGKKLHELCI